MMQLKGYPSYHYTHTDHALMGLAAKIIAGAIVKIKSERAMVDAVSKSTNVLETCKQDINKLTLIIVRNLLAERNLAHLQYKIKTSFPKLFKFAQTGLLYAEKSALPFDPSNNQLYSIIMDEEEGTVAPGFRLHDSNILRHSS
jgi:hypothetical protein